MDWLRPHSVIAPSLHGDVVMALARLRRPVTGRELAGYIGASHEGVRQVLLALEQQGLVVSQSAGRSRMVTLNRDHLAVRAIEALAGMRQDFFERLRALIGSWPVPRPTSVVVFGSVARGDATAASDVDVLIVRPDHVAPDEIVWLDQIAALAASVTRWTGNHCELVEYTAGELRKPGRARSTFVEATVIDGVTVYGKPLGRLLRGVA